VAPLGALAAALEQGPLDRNGVGPTEWCR
jgi:hypothetical protein